jgi:hypothetical protein
MAFDGWKKLGTTKVEERREMWAPRRLNNMGCLNILHSIPRHVKPGEWTNAV